MIEAFFKPDLENKNSASSFSWYTRKVRNTFEGFWVLLFALWTQIFVTESTRFESLVILRENLENWRHIYEVFTHYKDAFKKKKSYF